jgi:phenylpyruvate tautomerase
MPFIRLETTERLAPDVKNALCAQLSRLVAEGIGKPEIYVMAAVEDGVAMLHAGGVGPAAFADVRSIGGLSPKVNRALSERICRLLGERLSIPGERVYLNFTDVEAGRWGHDGTTLG